MIKVRVKNCVVLLSLLMFPELAHSCLLTSLQLIFALCCLLFHLSKVVPKFILFILLPQLGNWRGKKSQILYLAIPHENNIKTRLLRRMKVISDSVVWHFFEKVEDRRGLIKMLLFLTNSFSLCFLFAI